MQSKSMLFCLSWGVFFLISAKPIEKTKTIEIDIQHVDFTKEPAQQSWITFKNAAPEVLKRTWDILKAKGYTLSSLSWGWRLGWVQVCVSGKESFCGELLREALFDNALVVRAEAATRIGEKYEGSGNLHIVRLLEQAFNLKDNMRNGKPLFVQKRILRAIKMVGGDEAINTGKRISRADGASFVYWQKLNNG